jgi:hypothetical protein
MPDVLDDIEVRNERADIGSSSEPGIVQVDYFGFSSSDRFFLPDGVSYVDLKVLNEGERRRYQNESNREIKLGRGGGGDASLKMRPGDDKHTLLTLSIVGWNLMRNGAPVPFTKQLVDQFLSAADPSLIDKIEKRIRQLNPWLLSEMTVEQIDEEIKSLEEMREVRLREEEGNAASSSR